jgi:hypothetical protein
MVLAELLVAVAPVERSSTTALPKNSLLLIQTN